MARISAPSGTFSVAAGETVPVRADLRSVRPAAVHARAVGGPRRSTRHRGVPGATGRIAGTPVRPWTEAVRRSLLTLKALSLLRPDRRIVGPLRRRPRPDLIWRAAHWD